MKHTSKTRSEAEAAFWAANDLHGLSVMNHQANPCPATLAQCKTTHKALMLAVDKALAEEEAAWDKIIQRVANRACAA